MGIWHSKKEMNVHTTHETLEKMLGLLRSRSPFCFTRYGDSQILGMEDWPGNKEEQVMTSKLRLLLQKAFQINDPDYLIAPACGFKIEAGMRSGTHAPFRNDLELVAIVERHKRTNEFWHCDAIHYGMLYDQEIVRQIFREIEKADVLIVAGEDLDPRSIAFKNADIVRIPMDNAFKHWELIYERIQEYDRHYQPQIILYACGLTSQVLQYFQFLDKPHITTINMGSVFNALLGITSGVHTRGWIRDNQEELSSFTQSL